MAETGGEGGTVMEDKRFNVYQIVLAYLFGRYQAYKAEGLFQNIGFNDFVRAVCAAPEEDKN